MGNESLHHSESFLADLSTLKKLRASFESQLHSSGSSSIETWLDKVTRDDRCDLFRELLEAELDYYRERGVIPPADKYLSRFPEFSREIEALYNSRELKSRSGSNDQSIDSTVGTPAVRLPDGGWAHWAAGDSIGRYVLERFLGRGAFGEVWRALDPELDRLVAIKLPRRRIRDRGDATSRFRDEARRAASLKNEGIVPVYDIGQVDIGPFIVSELIDGPTLAERIRSGPVSREDSVRIVARLARSLHQAHLAGLVHRDIKPSNVLLRPDGTPAITDFGLAISTDEQRSPEEGAVGTLTYMSPEQARGGGERVDGRSDLYSLGVIFYELLTGQLPFELKSSSELLDEIIHRDVRPPRLVDASIPPELERICRRCLEKEARLRYATGNDLAADLDAWLSPARPGSGSSKMALLVPALSLALLILAAGIGGGWLALAGGLAGGGSGREGGVHASVGPLQGNAGKSIQRSARNGEWLELLDQPLEKIAGLRGSEGDFLSHDLEQRTFNLRSKNNMWIMASGPRGGPPLRLRGSVSADEWLGSAGLCWGIVNDPEAVPKRRPQCFAILVERFDPAERVHLSLKRLIVGQIVRDVPWVNQFDTLADTYLEAPVKNPLALEIDVQEKGLEVWLEGKPVWKPTLHDLELLHELLTVEGSVGIAGKGKSVVVRDAKVLFQKPKGKEEK